MRTAPSKRHRARRRATLRICSDSTSNASSTKRARRRRRRRRRRPRRCCRRRRRYCQTAGKGVHAVESTSPWNRTTNTTSWERPNAVRSARTWTACSRAARRRRRSHRRRRRPSTRLAAPPARPSRPLRPRATPRPTPSSAGRRRQPGAGEAQAPVDELRGRLSLDDLTAEGGALQDAVDGLRRLEDRADARAGGAAEIGGGPRAAGGGGARGEC